MSDTFTIGGDLVVRRLGYGPEVSENLIAEALHPMDRFAAASRGRSTA